MKLTKDEEMLVLLYGDGTKTGLQKALMEMQKTLQAGRNRRAYDMGRPLHHGRGAVAPSAGYRKHKKHSWGG